MKCLHPKQASYVDLMGVRRFYTRPCGHCIACLHNKQDAWHIRALEQTKDTPNFVYDTLTFRPASLPCVEVSDILDAHPYLQVSPQSEFALKFYSKDSSVIPYVDRGVIRAWLHRARQSYYRNNGVRPKWKYLIFMEYGPKTSRPHFHLLFWNISKADYKRYLGRPWQDMYGMTKPTYFNGTSTAKDRSCITKYISKYCSKGVYESPWVKDGILPKPFHFVSQGLGVGYLKHEKFAWFYSPLASVFREMCSEKPNRDIQWGYDDPDEKRHVKNLLKSDIHENFNIPESALKALSVYYDDAAIPHPLPRYYKQKILNLLRPNVLSYSVQTALLARADMQHNQALQKFALTMGEFAGRIARNAQTAFLGLSRKLYNLLCSRFALAERLQVFTKAERRKTWLVNHYLRLARGVNTSLAGDYHITPQYLAMVC